MQTVAFESYKSSDKNVIASQQKMDEEQQNSPENFVEPPRQPIRGQEATAENHSYLPLEEESAKEEESSYSSSAPAAPSTLYFTGEGFVNTGYSQSPTFFKSKYVGDKDFLYSNNDSSLNELREGEKDDSKSELHTSKEEKEKFFKADSKDWNKMFQEAMDVFE